MRPLHDKGFPDYHLAPARQSRAREERIVWQRFPGPRNDSYISGVSNDVL